jgi:PAS domain-containing protein
MTSRSVRNISSSASEESPREGHGQLIQPRRKDPSFSKLKSKEMEQNAAETNEQFADTEVIGIISIDATGKILYSNAKAQEIMDYPSLTGACIHNFVPQNYMGTDRFQKRHEHLVKSFFSRPSAGGRVLDPGTILRAKLMSGKLVPLNIGLEAKINPSTGMPRLVVAYITEASTIIDQSKVEKMLSRATLVVIQQLFAQAILSSIASSELYNIPSLQYSGLTDDQAKLAFCKDYTFNEMSTDGDGGQDYKMLLYMMSTAMTILISVLPLFVNHLHDHDKDESTVWTKKEMVKYVANVVNDFQEYLSTIKSFRKTDLVLVTTVVCTTNLFLLYILKSLPNEYEKLI